MASQTIPSLPAATSLNGTELLWAVQSGTDKRVSTGQLATLANGGGTVALPIPIKFNGVTITTAYNVQVTDGIILATASAGVPTFPTAVGIQYQAFIFKNASGSSITPATTSSQTIDGAAPVALANHGVLRIFSDGTNWQTF